MPNPGFDLPPGLSLEPRTGLVTGVPTVAGAFSFAVQVLGVCNPPEWPGPYSDAATFTIFVDTVLLTSLAPDAAPAGGPGFTLTLIGGGFRESAVVSWNGSDRMTTFADANSLTAEIPASDLQSPGRGQITVRNPNGVVSNALSFTIGNGVPIVSALSPASAALSSGDFTLTIDGRLFAPGATVEFGGAIHTTLLSQSATQIKVAIANSELNTVGGVNVAVTNPAPGGGTSNIKVFTVGNPGPSITALAPTGAVIEAPVFAMIILGTGFVPGSVASFDGRAMTTRFVDTTELSADVLASDLAMLKTAQIVVVNPPPGGGSSNAFPFPLQNPAPALTRIFPESINAGAAGFQMTITGVGYIAASTVSFGGTIKTPTSQTPTRLVVDILASEVTAAARIDVKVINPPPGGGASFPLTFTVNPAAALFGVLERASVDSNGAQATDHSVDAFLSGDGRYVGFTSYAPNIVSGDVNQASDYFLRDTCRGSSAPSGCLPSTVQLSLTSDGLPAGSQDRPGVTLGSQGMGLSYDARFALFVSYAENILGTGDTNHDADLFLRDTCLHFGVAVSGCTATTVRIDWTTFRGMDRQTAAEDIINGSLSPDGNFAAYSTTIVNPAPDGSVQVFLRDSGIILGNTPRTVRISAPDTSTGDPELGTPADGNSFAPYVSAFARAVAFGSSATNLVSTLAVSGTHVYLRLPCIDQSPSCSSSTWLVDFASDNATPANGSSIPFGISADGRFVTFSSSATNLISGLTIPPGTPGQLYLRDTCRGASACTPRTILLSPSQAGGFANGGFTTSVATTISVDNRFVIFGSDSTNLVADDFNGQPDVFVRDTCLLTGGGFIANCTPLTRRLSVGYQGGAEGNDVSGGSFALSLDGQFAAFPSFANNFIAHDTNAKKDVYLAATGLIAALPGVPP